MKRDCLPLLMAESRDLAAFLADLTEEQWHAPSLCAGWTVKDVVAHMAVGHSIPVLQFGVAVARRGFRVDAASFALARSYAQNHTTREVLTLFREGTCVPPRATARFVPAYELFTDHLVHHQDVRRALGQPREIPADRLLAALQSLHRLSARTGSRRRMSGLRVVANDVDFTRGEGPLELRGPAEALVMALTGRAVALADLNGRALATLADRLARDVPRQPPLHLNAEPDQNRSSHV